MSNRKKIEKEITKEISTKVSQFGFKLVGTKELIEFEAIHNNVKWELWFYLTNTTIYSLFCKASVTYVELSEIINTILDDAELSRDIRIVDNDLKITKENGSLKISCLEEINSFCELFFERIKKIKENFWIPYSDPISQMESFTKPHVGHWINGDMTQNVLLWVSTGIKEDNIKKIEYGFSRGFSWIAEVKRLYGTNYHLEQDEYFLNILNKKLAEKGYIPPTSIANK